VPLEELDGPLVALRGRNRLEGTEIPPFAPDHAAKLLIGAVPRHPASPPESCSSARILLDAAIVIGVVIHG
jgi:hypothetical protein